MTLAGILSEFKVAVAQCDSLIANAHKVSPGGESLLPALDREQITVAAFLNMFIAWETFLESSLVELMLGTPPTSGRTVVRYVQPPNLIAARDFSKGNRRYFNYGKHEDLIPTVKRYFEDGYPFEPHLSEIVNVLSNLETLRNFSAHNSSTTTHKLESFAAGVLGIAKPGISLYQILISPPKGSTKAETIFSSYRDTLLVAATLITKG